MAIAPNDVNVLSVETADLDVREGQNFNVTIEAEAGSTLHATGGAYRVRMTMTDTTNPSLVNSQDITGNYGDANWPPPACGPSRSRCPAARPPAVRATSWSPRPASSTTRRRPSTPRTPSATGCSSPVTRCDARPARPAPSRGGPAVVRGGGMMVAPTTPDHGPPLPRDRQRQRRRGRGRRDPAGRRRGGRGRGRDLRTGRAVRRRCADRRRRCRRDRAGRGLARRAPTGLAGHRAARPCGRSGHGRPRRPPARRVGLPAGVNAAPLFLVSDLRGPDLSRPGGHPSAAAARPVASRRVWLQRTVALRPRPRGIHLVTGEVLEAVPEIALRVGLAHLIVLTPRRRWPSTRTPAPTCGPTSRHG